VGPALVSAAAAVTCWTGFFGIAAEFPLGYLLFAVTAWALTNHFFEVIEHKAAGDADWPVLSIETFAGARQQIGLAFLALLAVLGFGTWAAARLAGNTPAVLFGGIVAASLPASAALLGVTRDFGRAVSPAAIVHTIARLGLDYALLLLASALVAAAGVLAIERRTFVAIFITSYVWLVLGYLIGGLVYERRIALGVHAPHSPEARQAAQDARGLLEQRAALDHAYGIAARGNVAGALDYLERYADAAADPLETKVRLFHEMARWQSGVPAAVFGGGLAAALEAAGRGEEAAKIAVTCRYLEERAAQRS
jgi:hypothetical protein